MKIQAAILFACLVFQLHNADAAWNPWGYFSGVNNRIQATATKLLNYQTQQPVEKVETPSTAEQQIVLKNSGQVSTFNTLDGQNNDEVIYGGQKLIEPVSSEPIKAIEQAPVEPSNQPQYPSKTEFPSGAIIEEVEDDDNDKRDDDMRIREEPFILNSGQFDFSMSLLKAIEKNNSGKSYIFSPHSTYRVLLLTYMGLELPGETTQSLKDGLYLDWATSENFLIKAFNSDECRRSFHYLAKGLEFNTADRLYISEGTKMKSKAIEDFLHKLVERVDFSNPEGRRQEINAWVEEVTRNQIKDLIPQGAILPSTDLVVANAAFFKGLWATKFDKANTQMETFNDVAEVEMMNVKSKFNYGVLRKEKATYLEMPYKTIDKTISMLIFLPNENSPTAIDDLLDQLTGKTISQALQLAREKEVDVKFPKIDMESEFDLPKTFAEMGFKDLPFETIVHKAKITVDEEGSLAAAATAAIYSRGLMLEQQLEFHCKYSFLLMIVDRYTHEILFAGPYRGPSTPEN